MDLYAENILDHFRNPRNCEAIHGADIEHSEENLECGDEVRVFLKLSGASTKHDIIEEIGWTGTGCAISQAGISILSEELKGMNTGDALKLSKGDIDKLLGVPIGPRRFKCALMGLHCVKNALHRASGRPVQTWVETVALE